MKGRGDRPARVAERIREEVSLILQNRVKDPGMGVVTITDVTITPDLKTARVHYSVLGGDEEKIAVRDALRRSEGDAIGSQLALALALRKMGKTATVLNADPVPGNLAFLPGADSVVYEENGSRYEVAVVVGCGASERTGRVQAELCKPPVLV